jgi:hypothetical protein
MPSISSRLAHQTFASRILALRYCSYLLVVLKCGVLSIATTLLTGSGYSTTFGDPPSEPFMLLKPGKKTLFATQDLLLLLLRRKDAATFPVALGKHHIRL